MAATKKQTGYLVKAEWFIEADLYDLDLFARVQKCKAAASGSFDTVGGPVTIITSTLTPTRR
jgi:hypothetical protein